ncbi:hypothetical protein GQ42DRAFT_113358, partial [Ramicandelaber brevisporus]
MLSDASEDRESLETQAAQLRKDLDMQTAAAGRAQRRAEDMEKMWHSTKQELDAVRSLATALEETDMKERAIENLESQLGDSAGSISGGSIGGSMDEDAQRKLRETEEAYLAAQRRAHSAVEETSQVKAHARTMEDKLRSSETQLIQRERELEEMNAKLQAYMAMARE